jgi:hypothetical protein
MGSLILAASWFSTAVAQTSPAAPQLQPYTAPDNSASAGVPPGWKVATGKDTFIQMTGPKGETIFLGDTIVAHDGSFRLGQRGTAGIDFSMPHSATLTQKLTMIVDQSAVLGGKPNPHFTVTSASPIQFPPALGQCGRFVATMNAGSGSMKATGAYCSFPLDHGGNFKNIMLLAQAPTAVAAADAPIASAVFASYRIPAAMLEKKLAPFTPAPTVMTLAHGRAKPGVSPVTNPGASADVSATCFDLAVIRALPTRQLPRECGGQAPNP